MQRFYRAVQCFSLLTLLFTISAQAQLNPSPFTFECSEENFTQLSASGSQTLENYKQNMQTYFETVVESGLKKMLTVNPELNLYILEILAKKPLTIDCASSRLENSLANHYVKHHRSRIDLGSVAKEIYQLAEKHPLLYPSEIRARIRDPRPFQGGYIAVVSFHEFLHYVGIDNLSTKQHNELGRTGFHFETDLIYSCASAVFSGQDWFTNDAEMEQARAMCASWQRP